MKTTVESLLFLACAVVALLYYILPGISHYNRFYLQNFDYGILYQSSGLLSRFEAPYLTTIGRHAWADDQDYLQLLLAPLHWLPSPHYWLLVSHSLAIFSVGILLFLFFRGRPHLSIGLSLMFWLSPFMVNMNVDLFHIEAAATLALITSALAILQNWPRLYLLASAAALVAKADVAITVGTLSALCLWKGCGTPEIRRALWGVLVLSPCLLAFNLWYVIPHFQSLSCAWIGADADPSSFSPRPSAPWFSAFWDNLFRLSYYQDALLKPEVGKYLLWLLWPLALALPRIGLLALLPLPAAGINIVSGSEYLTRGFFHYDHSSYAAVIIGLVFAFERRESKVPLGWLFAVVALALQLWGPQQLREPISKMLSREFWQLGKRQEVVVLERLNQQIPSSAVIAADYTSLNYLLEGRDGVYMLPNPFQSGYFGVYGHCETLHRPVQPDLVVVRGGYALAPELQALLSERYSVLNVPVDAQGSLLNFYTYNDSPQLSTIKNALSNVVQQ